MKYNLLKKIIREIIKEVQAPIDNSPELGQPHTSNTPDAIDYSASEVKSIWDLGLEEFAMDIDSYIEDFGHGQNFLQIPVEEFKQYTELFEDLLNNEESLIMVEQYVKEVLGLLEFNINEDGNIYIKL